ncbi:MAG: gliding motility protein GldC [Spirochaetes bacterium]|nr:gliding motility protein GldC [Spirochaetota bacterium]
MATEEKKEIIIRVGLDENAIPESISWLAPGASNGEEKADAFMLSIFSGNEKTTLGIDLWTKEMLVGDMNIFFYQSLKKMADVLDRATQDKEAAQMMRDFSRDFGRQVKLLQNE